MIPAVDVKRHENIDKENAEQGIKRYKDPAMPNLIE